MSFAVSEKGYGYSTAPDFNEMWKEWTEEEFPMKLPEYLNEQYGKSEHNHNHNHMQLLEFFDKLKDIYNHYLDEWRRVRPVSEERRFKDYAIGVLKNLERHNRDPNIRWVVQLDEYGDFIAMLDDLERAREAHPRNYMWGSDAFQTIPMWKALRKKIGDDYIIYTHVSQPTGRGGYRDDTPGSSGPRRQVYRDDAVAPDERAVRIGQTFADIIYSKYRNTLMENSLKSGGYTEDLDLMDDEYFYEALDRFEFPPGSLKYVTTREIKSAYVSRLEMLMENDGLTVDYS